MTQSRSEAISAGRREESWGHPDAPERFQGERRCKDCRARVNSYQQKRYVGRQGAAGPLLCYSCLSKRVDKELEELMEKERKRKAAQKRYDASARASAVGGRIRKARKALGISQKELANRVGFTYPQQVNSYERGRTRPSARALARLAEVLGVDAEDLMAL